MIQAIVFLPLAAAIIAGLGNRMIGNVPAKLITTGALFAACAMSWPIFIGFLAGTQEAGVHPVLSFIHSGDLMVDWSLRVDALTAVMLVVVTTVSALVHLGYSRPEAERAVERTLRDHADGRFEDLLRYALQAVSRRP